MKKLNLFIGVLLIGSLSFGQININKFKNKVGNKTSKTSSNDKESKEDSKEDSNNNSNSNGNQNNNSESSGDAALTETANYYDRLTKFIHNNLVNQLKYEWDENIMSNLEALDLPRLESKLNEDYEKIGAHLMIYPKKLPTSGMGTMTRANLADYKDARVADENADPPAGTNGALIQKFYKEYVMFKHNVKTEAPRIAKMIQTNIQKTEGEHNRNKYNKAKYTKRQATIAAIILPDDMRIADLKDEADRTYNSVLDGFGMMITGKYHRDHIQEIVVMNSKPSFGSETSAQEVETIIPGQSAYITGYFALTNKDAGGIPSLLFISPEDKYAKAANPWYHGTAVIASMFNGDEVKEEFRNNAYFTFNLFPDLSTVDYESHVQYFPHLNILKWLMYMPSEVLEIPVRYGRSEQMATGMIKIDLSGDNKSKLKTYYDQMLQKQLSAVTFPDLAGCDDAKSKIKNYSDLAKYGEVLRISMQQSGDIMKPWPQDDEIDFNTAFGYAAVKKSSGKIEIMPLEFRKRPTESIWQWWSVGTIPGLYPMDDNGTKITGVKKLEHGYEILPENVSKCGYWYSAN